MSGSDGGRRRFTFLPHAREQIEERGIAEEQVRATVEDPEWTGHGDYGRFVADRRFGRGVVRVVYNAGHEENVIISVMRRRRVGTGGGR